MCITHFILTTVGHGGAVAPMRKLRLAEVSDVWEITRSRDLDPGIQLRAHVTNTVFSCPLTEVCVVGPAPPLALYVCSHLST